MELSYRLEEIAKRVKKNSVIADIGTDHAYLPVYLIEKGIINKAIAMDINNGPLEKAQNNIDKFGLKSKINTRLSDGLDKLNKFEVDTVIIAGMGGLLICNILENGKDKIENVERIILQPQRDYESVRRCIHKLGYKIMDENVIKEEEHFYFIITAEKGQDSHYSDLEYKFGKMLINKNNEVFMEYINYKIKTITQLLNKLGNNQSSNVKHRILEINDELKQLQRLKEVKGTCQ